jgi:hypothetical protein
MRQMTGRSVHPLRCELRSLCAACRAAHDDGVHEPERPGVVATGARLVVLATLLLNCRRLADPALSAASSPAHTATRVSPLRIFNPMA